MRSQLSNNWQPAPALLEPLAMAASDIRVIGAGLPRTGTLTQKVALELLGLGPCYHWVDVIADLRRVEQWHRALDGNGPWDEIFDGFTGTVDWPGGFFTLELARLVGPTGRVLAVDIQPRMLASLRRRAARAGLADRVDIRVGSRDTLGLADLAGSVDLTLAIAVVHELPNVERFFTEVAEVSKPGAGLLIAEPTGHVKAPDFEAQLQAATRAGFVLEARPSISRSHAGFLRKA